MSGRRSAVAYSRSAKMLSLKTMILSLRCCSWNCIKYWHAMNLFGFMQYNT